jgi:predicted amidohydrolase
MRVAVAAYPLETITSFEAWAYKQRRLLGEAKALGANLAVLPEYLPLELAGAQPAAVREDFDASLEALQALFEPWQALHLELARELDLHIQAGTFLLRQPSGGYRNRAFWFTPSGEVHWQDKLQLTGFEKASGLIEPGDALKVFELDGLRVGIAVCYDSEFPLPVRAQREAGARLLLVPSCTDTPAGATRVRTGCMARALENRMFVARAVTAGELPWSPALDTNTGEAAIYAPMDVGLPADGVLAVNAPSETWAVAELPLSRLQRAASKSQVAVDSDWPQQLRPGLLRAQLLTLQH